MLLRFGTVVRRTPMGIALIMLFLALLFSSLFYMSHAMGTDHGMFDCPFAASGEAVCSMGAGEHLSSWESLTLAVPLLLLIVILIPFVRAVRALLHTLFHQLNELNALHGFCSREVCDRSLSIPDRLTELFARGILHPKLF